MSKRRGTRTPMRRLNPWLALTMDSWALAVESSSVIGLRTMKLAAGGPAAEAETSLMISEKMQSLATLQLRGMSGGLGLTPQEAARATLGHYRRKVRANRRRLTKEL